MGKSLGEKMKILGHIDEDIQEIPTKPEESFASKALRGTGGVLAQGIKGAVDMPGNMLSMPVNAINALTGGRTGRYEENPSLHLPTGEETTRALEGLTGNALKPESVPEKWGQELAYDVGSMAPFAIAGSIFGPVGAAGGLGAGALIKGLYKLSKVPAVAGAVKHGLKWAGASDFFAEMAKLATLTGGSIWGTGKKVAQAEPQLYGQVAEMAKGKKVGSWEFSKALDHEAEKIISQSGGNKLFMEAVVNDLKNMGKTKGNILTTSAPTANFEVELADALNKKVDLNNIYGEIKEHNALFSGKARIDYRLPNGEVYQFSVSKKAADDIGKLNNLVKEKLINPYAATDKEFSKVYDLAEGLHKGRAAMNDAHEFLRNSTEMRRWFNKHDLKKLFFPISYGGAAALHSPGVAAGAWGIAKGVTKGLDYANLLSKSAKARELYGKAMLAAANQNGQEVIRYSKQLEKVANQEMKNQPKILGRLSEDTGGVPGITDEEVLQ